MSKEETITIKKESLYKGLLVIAVLVIVYLLFAGGSGPAPTVNAGNNQPDTGSANAAAGIRAVEITAEDTILGDPDAPVSVIEFSDFECPFCARAFYGSVTELKASSEFANGEINFIYKQFPLTSIHPRAQKAAEATECAGDQGKFWEYHDTLFANQGALDITSLKGYASDLGLDTATFDNCLDSGAKAGKVADDIDAAVNSGGRGTPYFVVQNNDNGDATAVSGAVPFANIQQAINQVA